MSIHNRKRAILSLSFVLACLFTLGAAAQQNVVFVLIDALRADRLNATRNGEPLTPYLDGMPAVRFTNAVSPASWTLPAMVSLFTGQYVDTHGVFSAGGALPGNLQSMAAYFSGAGYTTIGIQTNGNLSAAKGFAQGFDQYTVVPAAQAVAATITSQGLAVAQAVGQPFFLYLHYLDPHITYAPPQSYRTLYGYPDPALSPAEKAVVEDFVPYFWDHLYYVMGQKPAPDFPVLSSVGKESVRELYDGETRYADDQVRILLDDILTRFPNTIVVIVADHGEHFWEHNQLGHVVTLYEQLTHVPLLVRAPGLSPATVTDVVDTLDVLPTLAGLTGLPPNPAWQGTDLFAARDPQGPAFSCAKSGSDFGLDLEMVRLGDTKLICNRKTGAVELYHLATDPGESVNIAGQQPVVRDQLLTLLNAHLRENALQNGADGPLSAVPGGSLEEGMGVRLIAPAGTGHVWFKDGQPLSDNPPHLTGAATAELSIDPLADADAGTYECMYSDAGQNLRITSPRTVTLLPADSLPLFGVGTALLMMVFFALLGSLLLRGRGAGSPDIP